MNKKILITIITLISIILLVVVGIYIFKNKDTSTNKNNEVKETLKEENQNNSEINVDKNEEQNDETIEESDDKDDEDVESDSNDVDNSIKENDSNNEVSTPNKDNSSNNNTNQNNNVSNSTTDDSPKEQTPWEKLGITEYEYYNTPVWSWQNVDFGVDLEGDKYCANETDCLSKCQKYGDEYLSQNNNGGYNCDDVLSYSGRYLGIDFEFFELQP